MAKVKYLTKVSKICYHQYANQEVIVLPMTVDNQTYLTATEAARRLGIARGTFNQNVAVHLHQYKFGALRRVYYLQSEVDAYNGPREIESKDDR